VKGNWAIKLTRVRLDWCRYKSTRWSSSNSRASAFPITRIYECRQKKHTLMTTNSYLLHVIDYRIFYDKFFTFRLVKISSFVEERFFKELLIYFQGRFRRIYFIRTKKHWIISILVLLRFTSPVHCLYLPKESTTVLIKSISTSWPNRCASISFRTADMTLCCK